MFRSAFDVRSRNLTSRFTFFFNTVTAACLLGLPALSGTLAEAAIEAEAMIAADDLDGALAQARDIHAQIWDMTQNLGFTEALLVAEPAAGYGIYNPRETISFKPGEPIVIYAEPTGFGYGSPGEGLYAIGFIVDLQVRTAGGEVLGDSPNLTELNLTSRYRNREFQANITYTLDGLAPGRYVLQTTLRDKHSVKNGIFETEIEIVE